MRRLVSPKGRLGVWGLSSLECRCPEPGRRSLIGVAASRAEAIIEDAEEPPQYMVVEDRDSKNTSEERRSQS